ncbi:MAG TPA: SRPBCC domain-containing protein [Cyclobacteriaceae bacterium]|nr:SRPBCC domain-containing protein [Cyclobacteriaceae bacterium]
MTIAVKNELVIERVINAPRALVWKAFTEADHLKHWWGPVGFKLEVLKLDVRKGGIFHFAMKADDGAEMFGRFDYINVQAPEKIIFTNSFADADGNHARAPFSNEWPIKVLNTWTFEEKNGKTTLLLCGEPFEATETEMKRFVQEFPGMNEGFGGTFDQLDAYLATLK